MKICVVGSGYVGLVTAACFADSGNDVIAVDKDPEKVEAMSAGTCPIFEPGLEELMLRNMAAHRLRFTTDLAEGIAGAEIIFSAVGTPPRPDGSADLSAVEAVAVAVGQALTGPAVFVNKSTVPVGTGRRVAEILASNTKHPFNIVSNPEFLKEGTALDDFLRPDRVVIGADDPDAGELVAELYKPFVRNNRPILMMSVPAAEMAKYASNAYLSTRISFINEIAEICEKMGIDIDEVRQGMGSDARIGHHFLYPGIGYGGSCFPKDVQALSCIGREVGVPCNLLDSVHSRNQRQWSTMVERIKARLGGDLTGKRVAIWGIAFKPKTDDIREAPAVYIMGSLIEAGAHLVAYDPEAIPNTKAVFDSRMSYTENAYDALASADALLINTEWNEFRSPDFDRIKAALKQPLIFDGRNLYELKIMRRRGFEYHSVGRPSVGVE